MSPPLIELRNLTRRYGDFTAVDGVSLAIAAGEFLTLLGASGSGKTTTLRLIAGFDQATSGQVIMDGDDLTGLPPFKRNINTVFQSYALFPHMSVRDNVAYGLRMRKVERGEIARRVDEVLDMVKLGDLGARAPRQLSGGQQQRVALARALVNRPRVLLLDEPLGALDLKLRKEMQLELKHLQTQVGITFVYVTHDQEEALTMSDRIALMRSGRIEQVGPPRTMYAGPRTRYVADFIGETNLLKGSVATVRDGIATLDVAGTRLRAPVPEGLTVSEGSEAWLSVRPESVEKLEGEIPGGYNHLTGRITEAVYAGSTIKLHLDPGNGERLVLHHPSDRGGVTVGEDARIGWPVERGVLLAE